MKRNLMLFVSLLLPAVGHSDVVTDTHCSLVSEGGGPSVSQTNPSSCSVALLSSNGQVGKSMASMSYALSVPGVSSPGLSSEFKGTARPFPAVAIFPGPGNGAQDGEADASGSANLTLYSLGPVRSGFLQFSESVTTTSGENGVGMQARITLGSLNTTCNGYGGFTPVSCVGNFGTPNGVSSGTTEPFLLGTSFPFSDYLRVNGSSLGSLAAFSYGTGLLDLNFQLLEGDGVTPVQLFVSPQTIPEPSVATLLMVALPVLWCVIARTRRICILYRCNRATLSSLRATALTRLTAFSIAQRELLKRLATETFLS